MSSLAKVTIPEFEAFTISVVECERCKIAKEITNDPFVSIAFEAENLRVAKMVDELSKTHDRDKVAAFRDAVAARVRASVVGGLLRADACYWFEEMKTEQAAVREMEKK